MSYKDISAVNCANCEQPPSIYNHWLSPLELARVFKCRCGRRYFINTNVSDPPDVAVTQWNSLQSEDA